MTTEPPDKSVERERLLRRKKMRARGVPLILACALVLATMVALSVGSFEVSFGRVLRVLVDALSGNTSEITSTERTIVLSVRLPRVCAAILVGATLAVAGVTSQAVFRNPLADAGLIGVSSGASLGAALAIVVLPSALVQSSYRAVLLPAFAFAGGLLVTYFVLGVARRGGVFLMLLTGVAANAFTFSVVGLLSTIASDSALRNLTYWMLGSFASIPRESLLFAALPMLALLLLAPWSSRALDILVLGDRDAAHLGVDVSRLRTWLISITALGVGAAVATAGLIGFVGLVVPHVVRLVIGPRHGPLITASALLGATLLLVADTVARTSFSPLELPIGALTAIVGAPVLVALLLRAAPRVSVS